MSSRFKDGGVEPTTVTVNDPLARLPLASSAEQRTKVIPTGNNEPDAGAQVTGTLPLMASSAVVVKETTSPAGLAALTEIGAGSVSAGLSESRTVTRNVRVVVPEKSVAVQLTVVVPIAKSEPEDGEQTALIGRPTSSSPCGSPVLVTTYRTKAPAELLASTVKLAGTLRTGPAAAAAANPHTIDITKNGRRYLDIVDPSNAYLAT
jgi:hypothetical protein